MPTGVVGAGNFIVDFVKTVDCYPAEQTLANIVGECNGPGGAPYNVLKDLAALGSGLPLAAIGRVGDDEWGHFVVDDCRSSGIDVNQLRTTSGTPTSYTLVMAVEGTGKRTFFHQRGANAKLEAADCDFSGLLGWHLHFGYLLLLDALEAPDGEFGTGAARVLASARRAGLTTSIDLVSEDSDRFASVVGPALPFADIVFLNEFELLRMTGVDILPDGQFSHGQASLAGASLDLGGALVVHWQDGAAVVKPGGEVIWRGAVDLPQSEVRSLAGCGDAFAAGFLLGHLRADPLSDCLDLGACCAAACARGLTCTDGVGSEADCLALGSRFGFKEL